MFFLCGEEMGGCYNLTEPHIVLALKAFSEYLQVLKKLLFSGQWGALLLPYVSLCT